MRNKYPGYCYNCGNRVEAGEGYFERHQGRWRVKCIKCTAKNKLEKGKNLSPHQKDSLKQSESNWRKILWNENDIPPDTPKGDLIPTNDGFREPEDLVDDITYYSYAHNRDLGISANGWKKMMNYGLNDVDMIQKNNEKVDAMERRYLRENTQNLSLNWSSFTYEYAIDIDYDFLDTIYPTFERESAEEWFENFLSKYNVVLADVDHAENVIIVKGEINKIAECAVMLTGHTYKETIKNIERNGQLI